MTPQPDTSGFVDLACGAGFVRVEPSLAAMASQRAFVPRFVVSGEGRPLLTLHRAAHVDGQRVEGPLGACTLRLEGDQLHVEVGEGPFLGELVLRLAYFVATVGQGGFLIHAAALRRGDAALVACGKSGDGKSTLSRLSAGAGLTLMTDEVVQLFPDGRVGGTPFRSDPDNAGTPGLARARAFVALEKADHEALEPLAPAAATQLILAQCFDVELDVLPPAERRRRALGFLASTQLGTLAFRKHPDAGRFVEELLRPSP